VLQHFLETRIHQASDKQAFLDTSRQELNEKDDYPYMQIADSGARSWGFQFTAPLKNAQVEASRSRPESPFARRL
jgi:hypothetical protein